MTKAKVTILDIAHMAGVSKATVSRYLNGHYEKMSAQTKEKIKQVIADSHYHVNRQAQSITKKQTFIIGIIVADIENIFSSMLFKGADQVFENVHYQIMLMNSDNSQQRERQQLERLLDLRVDGIILQPISQHAEDYQFLADTHVPTVIVDRKLTPERWPAVVTDNYQYSKMLMDYILRLGYQRIVVVSEPVAANFPRQDRYRAVQDTCRRQSVPTSLIEIQPATTDDELYRQLLQVTHDLQDKAAIYALKGTLLMRIVRILARYQIAVPSEMGVAAFDDWDWATLTSPQITTIQQNPKAMGQQAAERLLEVLAGKEPPMLTNVESEFVVRQSLTK